MQDQILEERRLPRCGASDDVHVVVAVFVGELERNGGREQRVEGRAREILVRELVRRQIAVHSVFHWPFRRFAWDGHEARGCVDVSGELLGEGPEHEARPVLFLGCVLKKLGYERAGIRHGIRKRDRERRRLLGSGEHVSYLAKDAYKRFIEELLDL